AEFFEFTHACFANAPYVKIPHPIVVIDRACNHAKSDEDPFVHHGTRLTPALKAISQVWNQRGRTAFTYGELEDRWDARQYRTEDIWRERHVDDADEFDFIQEREKDYDVVW
ncbi:MAG: hypothetical protein OEM32_04525, partial [Acidimicrobiia bacterium]|nr:hypothetical protein [Acidimicrobiia bacterium]